MIFYRTFAGQATPRDRMGSYHRIQESKKERPGRQGVRRGKRKREVFCRELKHRLHQVKTHQKRVGRSGLALALPSATECPSAPAVATFSTCTVRTPWQTPSAVTSLQTHLIFLAFDS